MPDGSGQQLRVATIVLRPSRLTTWPTWQLVQWEGQALPSSTQVVTHPVNFTVEAKPPAVHWANYSRPANTTLQFMFYKISISIIVLNRASELHWEEDVTDYFVYVGRLGDLDGECGAGISEAGPQLLDSAHARQQTAEIHNSPDLPLHLREQKNGNSSQGMLYALSLEGRSCAISAQMLDWKSLFFQEDETGEVTFYMKGADTVMQSVVQYNDWLDEEVRGWLVDTQEVHRVQWLARWRNKVLTSRYPGGTYSTTTG